MTDLVAVGVPRRAAPSSAPKLRGRRGAVAFVVASSCAVLAFEFAPSAAEAVVSVPHSSAASAYCARLPATKVSSVVGWTVTFTDADVKGSIFACLYQGSTGNVTIEKETGLPASDLATRGDAEAMTQAMFPKGTKITFTPLSALGPAAFYWTAVIGGHPFSGANTNKGTTGYDSEMSGTLQQSKLEQLEELGISA
jgi:hypothetical protein